VLVAALYWVLLYPADKKAGKVMEIGDYAFHGPAAVLLVIDFACSTVLFGFRHILFNCAFIIAYLTVNVIFTFSSGKPLYIILDWANNPGKSLRITGISVFVSLFIFVMFWGIHLCKSNLRANRKE